MRKLLTSSWAALALFVPGCFGSVVITQNAGDFASRPVIINFDAIAAGTDVSGQVVSGVRFVAPHAPLVVVNAGSTYTPAGFTETPNPSVNVLPSTTGAHILSPGGAMLGPGNNPAVEGDWLTLEFLTPVVSFGFDHLSQSADGVGFTMIEVYDPSNNLIHSGSVTVSNLGGAAAPGGADFWGIIATGGTLIGRIEIKEGDNDARFPDANIGFDSLRFETAPSSEVPEPATMALAGVGLAAVAAIRRRR